MQKGRFGGGLCGRMLGQEREVVPGGATVGQEEAGHEGQGLGGRGGHGYVLGHVLDFPPGRWPADDDE